MIALVEDIAELKRAQEASQQMTGKIQALARQKEDQPRLVIDTIPTMAWSLLPDGAVDFVNQRWLEYTGLSLEEALEDPTSTVHPEDLPRVVKKWIVDMAAGEPYENEMRLRRADGEYRWFLVRTVPLRDEQGIIVKWYGTSFDIEDRKRAEDALRRSAAELQALSRRLVELQEAERKDLARELHDRVGQNLTALNINLGILNALVPAHDNAEAGSRLADSVALVKSTVLAIQNVVSELRPPMLVDFGLVAALHWYAKEFSLRTGVAVSVSGKEPSARISAGIEIALYRIAQEALNNVAKHAHATTVALALWPSGSEYVMSVQDDGIGFDGVADTSDKPKPGLGMVTMRERAQAVGGRFEVRALPGRGTQLTVRVPY